MQSRERLRIVVLLACHNRAPITQRFFDSFIESVSPEIDVKFNVVNDGSTDDTGVVISRQPFPINVVNGTGNWFWAKSMQIAESSIGDIPDGILWVNDDLILNPDTFQKLILSAKTFPNAVLVGQVYDILNEKILYGGYTRDSAHPLRLKLMETSDKYTKADTFNGNFVYIPIEVRLSVGPIDGSYSHAYADCDYGYRVRQAGYEIRVIPGSIGTCEANKVPELTGRKQKIKFFLSEKRNPFESQFHFFWKFTERKYRFLIPIFLAYPLIKIIVFNQLK